MSDIRFLSQSSCGETAGVRLPAANSFVYKKSFSLCLIRVYLRSSAADLLFRSENAIPPNHFLASKIRLNGVSLARLNCLKPPARTVSRIAASGATAPSAGPFRASEFDVQQSVEAPANVRPM